jgi:hypothetical protein
MSGFKQQTLQILSNPLSIAHEKLARERLRNVRYSATPESKRSVDGTLIIDDEIVRRSADRTYRVEVTDDGAT